MKNNLIFAVVISLVIGGGIGYFVGKQSAGPARGTFNGQVRQFGQGNQQFGNRNGGPGGMRPVAGEIISKDDNSITVKMPDGSSKIVLVSSKTAVNKSATGTLDDLKTGVQIAAFGTQNSDGSLTAQNVQLNPQMRMFVRPSGANAQPSK